MNNKIKFTKKYTKKKHQLVRPKKTKNRKNYQQKGGAKYQEALLNPDVVRLLMRQGNIKLNFISPAGTAVNRFYQSSKPVDDRIYQKHIAKGIERYEQDTRETVISFLFAHGLYFNLVPDVRILNYFVVPDNVIICHLTPPDLFSTSSKKPQDDLIRNNIYDSIIKYRSNLKKEKFFFEHRSNRNGFANSERYDYFKFSNWYYPGQICHNFQLNMSDKDFSIYEDFSFDIKKRDGSSIKSREIRDNLFSKFKKPSSDLKMTATDICSSLDPQYKYVLVIECCNISNIMDYPETSVSTDLMYDIHRLNQSVVKQVDSKLDLPSIEETESFKYQGFRGSLDGIIISLKDKSRFQKNKLNRKLKIYKGIEAIKDINLHNNYKIDIFYEILEHINNPGFKLRNMKEYISFLLNLNIPEILHFTNFLLQYQTEINKTNVERLIMKIFIKPTLFSNPKKEYISNMFFIYQTLVDPTYTPHIYEIEMYRSFMSDVIKQHIEAIILLQETISSLKLGIDMRNFLSCFTRYLDLEGDDKHKYYILENIFQPPLTQDKTQIKTFCIQKSYNITPSKQQNFSDYTFQNLEIKDCNTINFDDNLIKSNTSWLERNKLSCVVIDSIFTVSPRFQMFKFIRDLNLVSLKEDQKCIMINEFLENLEVLTVNISSNVGGLIINNSSLNSLLIEGSPSLHPSLFINMNTVNLITLKLVSLKYTSVTLTRTPRISELELVNCEINIDKFNLDLSSLGFLKKLKLEFCTGVGESDIGDLLVPGILEELSVLDLSECKLNLSATNSQIMTELFLELVMFNPHSIPDAKFGGIRRFSLAHLEIINEIINQQEIISEEEYELVKAIQDLFIIIRQSAIL